MHILSFASLSPTYILYRKGMDEWIKQRISSQGTFNFDITMQSWDFSNVTVQVLFDSM